MHDPRIDQLARQLVRHSTSLKRGERVLLDLFDVPEEVGIALVREARARGAEPFVHTQSNRVLRELWSGATEGQMAAYARHRLAEMKDMDAYIAVRGSHNISELGDVPQARMNLVTKHMRKVVNHRVNKTKWCVLRWPHPAMAQQAGMSTGAFEDFFFRLYQVIPVDFALPWNQKNKASGSQKTKFKVTAETLRAQRKPNEDK